MISSLCSDFPTVTSRVYALLTLPVQGVPKLSRTTVHSHNTKHQCAIPKSGQMLETGNSRNDRYSGDGCVVTLSEDSTHTPTIGTHSLCRNFPISSGNWPP